MADEEKKFNDVYSATNTISKIKVKGTEYDVLDEAAKTVIQQLGTAAVKDVATSIGDSETGLVTGAQVASALKDINGAMRIVDATAEGYTPKAGDVKIDGTKEYVYVNSAWIELGDEGLHVPNTRTIAGLDLQDDVTASELITALNLTGSVDQDSLGKLAMKDSATGTVASQDITGVKATGTSAGSIAVALTQTSTAATLSTDNYTPAGSVSVSAATTGIKGVNEVGTAASWDATVTNGVLEFSWTANTPTTATESTTVATGIESASFSGTEVENMIVTGVNYDKATVDADNTKFTGENIELAVGTITVAEQSVTVE